MSLSSLLMYHQIDNYNGPNHVPNNGDHVDDKHAEDEHADVEHSDDEHGDDEHDGGDHDDGQDARDDVGEGADQWAGIKSCIAPGKLLRLGEFDTSS